MNDAEYLFRVTSKEAKRTARGAFNKKGGSRSKKCSLPSDHLTPKQLKERNGIVKTWNLKAPMHWETFKSLPQDLLNDYILRLTRDYKGRQKDIADMLGVSSTTLYVFLQENGLSNAIKRTGRRTPHPEWLAFLAQQEGTEEHAAKPIPEPVEETKCAPAPSSAVEQPLPAVCRGGCISYNGKPFAVFESALRVLHPNTEYRISISFSELEQDRPDISGQEV